jgi:hypothetical protein
MRNPGPEKYALDRPQFVRLMNQSYEITKLVAKWFECKGFRVEIPELRISPSWNDRLDYSDSGDFYFFNNQGKKRVEVKYWPKIDFKSLDEVYANVIVNAVNSWDAAEPKPDLHIIVNKSKSHVVWINSTTKQHWYKDRVYDRRKNGERTFYFCPKRYLSCVELS